MGYKLGHIKVNSKMIKFPEKEDLDGMKIKNIMENGKIMNYPDMEF